MDRSEKERIVAELTDRLREAETLIVADYRGLSTKDLQSLRRELAQHGARFTIVKNTLTRRAAEAAGAETVLALLEGPSALAFIESDGDPVAVAKALRDTARTTRVLEIRGGLLEGKQLAGEDIERLATLPPLEALHAQVLAAIIAPLNAVVGLVNAPLQDLVGLIDARIEQLGGEEEAAGDASPDAAAEAAPEPVAEAAPEPAAEVGAAEEPAQETAPEATEVEAAAGDTQETESETEEE
jgi:large subunit ribosomal protein L10